MCILIRLYLSFKIAHINMNICKLISLDIYSHREIYARRGDVGKIYSHVLHHIADGTTIGRSLRERSPEIHNLASDRRKRVNQQKYETRFVAAKALGNGR